MTSDAAVTVSSISVFPVKSTAGRSLDEVAVAAEGLVDDRRWMVVDGSGESRTARRDRALLTVAATPLAGGLRLESRSAEREPLEVTEPTGASVPVTVHGRPLHGIPAPPEASEWIGAAIGRPDSTLVHIARPRPLNPAHSRAGDRTAFADAYPVTLATTASLRRLQDWVTETALERGEDPVRLDMERFRPNLVIDGELEPFVEDGWTTVCVGDVPFDVAKCIDRCVLTTVDPRTLESGPEPIRTLARHRSWDGATWFGIQLIPRGAGVVRVGDEVSGIDDETT
ncbi:MOSC domain-containing protein [Nostocoides sp. F2B08]|uniref:MOSC domain-containing protein n=1 Tax=Nostocoides sp. F2B08 TaxID=2653936 RepID=UPI0012636BA8|nr:MOSC N-terminal beta barrel domain-containing protein [Tetrasphaera sp. F2B08]KAB7746295.1 MOSC domain-containing protein [Tetrasphaera sp. F2B08]